MKKMKIRVKLESDKKFYESDYRNIYDCYKSSEKYVINKFRKNYPNAIIYDVFSKRDYDYIAGYMPIGDHYTSWVRGYYYLPSKANYRQIIKMGKIKLN